MTTTKKKSLIPTPTDWEDVSSDEKKPAPPSDLLLLVRCVPRVEGEQELEFYQLAYYSERLRVFLEVSNLECLDAMFYVTHYHVVSGPDGATIKLVSDEEPAEGS